MSQNTPCVCIDPSRIDLIMGAARCSSCGGWLPERPSATTHRADGCGDDACIVSQCRANGYCGCLRVPFEAAAEARRARERARANESTERLRLMALARP